MKKKQTKRAISFLMLVTMLVSLLSPMTAAAETAAETTPILQYLTEEEQTVTNGGNYLDASEDLEQVRNLDAFTLTMEFKTSSNGLQSIFNVGSTEAGTKDKYFTLYLTGNNTVGVEVRDGAKNPKINTTTAAYADNAYHKITLTYAKDQYYRIYIDGARVLDHTTAADVARFLKDLGMTPNTMTFGKGTRVEGANSYPFTGSIKNISIYDQALSEKEILKQHGYTSPEESLVYEAEGKYIPSGSSYEPIVDEEALTALKALDQGTVSVCYRAEAANNGLMALFSISDSTDARKYFDVFVQPSADIVGLELMGSTGSNGVIKYAGAQLKGKHVNNTEWHTVTVTKANTAGDGYRIYLDGVELGVTPNTNKFLNGIETANTIGIGFTDRAAGQNEYPFTGAIDNVKVYSQVLSTKDIAKEYNDMAVEAETVEVLGDTVKTEPEALFYAGYDGSIGYRIPSLLMTSRGTLIAGIDKRQSGQADCGNIDTAVRRKENAAAPDSKFGEPIIVLDMNNNGGGRPAFTIDNVLLEDKDHQRVYMLIDMIPESTGLMAGDTINGMGSGHEVIDGKAYKSLYTDGRDASTKFGTIREDGIVYDNAGNKTDYVVVTKCQAPYTELGNLYKNGEFRGNIYRYTGEEKGDYSALRTQYLWLTYSDDDGATWSVPQDITAQVKTDEMLFLGTGPGVGIQLQNKHLVFPVYSAGANVGATQSSAIIVSEDFGKTWTLKESPNPNHNLTNPQAILTESQVIQTPNGDLHLFMRNTSGRVKESVSSDEGAHWTTPVMIAEIPDVYCQLTVTTYEKNNEMYVILANPTGNIPATPQMPNRNSGKVYIGKVGADDTTITWTDNKFLNHQRYLYSCLTVVKPDDTNPRFGLFYEDETYGPDMLYTEFDEAWIKNKNTEQVIPAPEVLEKEVTLNGNTLNITLKFDQPVFAAGAPKLQLTVGDTSFEAAYVSGSTTDAFTFTAEIPAGKAGVVKMTGLDTAAGYLENDKNVQPAEMEGVIYDLTKITSGLTIKDYSSQHSASTAEGVDGAAANVLDGNPNTYWHSTWGNAGITLPQYVTVDLGSVKNIYKLSYLPRQNSQSGRVTEYEILGSTDGETFTLITDGAFASSANEQFAEFAPTEVRYVRFKVNKSTAEGSCSVAELGFFEYADGAMTAGDPEALRALTASVTGLTEADYSAASWAKAAAAKAKAEEVLAMTGIVPQNKIDNAYNALFAAKRQLVKLSPADSIKAQYGALKKTDYTEESWTAFTAAVGNIDEQLNAALKDREITDVIMKTAYEMSKLVKVPADPEKTVYTVYVEGAEYATGKYNEKVSVHAEKENFVCWMASSEADGQQSVVSVNPDYTFYIANNVYLTAVYGEKTIDPAATLVNTIAIPAADGKVNARFVGQLTVPEGAALKRAGLVWSTKDTPETLRLDADGVKVTDVKSVNNAYQFSVTINGMPKDRFVRGVVFAEIVLADGTTGNIFYSVEGRVTN